MRNIFIVILSLVLVAPTLAQERQGGNQNLPILVSLHFHALAVPFRHLKTNFKNIGIGIGTELNYGKQSRFNQRFSVVWYRNKYLGNGWLFQSQGIWRPTIGNSGFGEIKAGLGYLFTRRPIKSFQLKNGDWIAVNKKGKGLFSIPVGFGVGYILKESDYQISPFLSYDILVVSNYNRSVPIITETMVQFGTHLKKQ